MSHTIHSPASTSQTIGHTFRPAELYSSSDLKEYDEENGIRAVIYILSSLAVGLREGRPQPSSTIGKLHLRTSLSSILSIDEVVAVTGCLLPAGDQYVIRSSVVTTNIPRGPLLSGAPNTTQKNV